MVTMIGRAKKNPCSVASICVLTLALLTCVLGQGASQKVEEPLASAMVGAGIVIEEATIDLWGRFDQYSGDKANQTALADRVAELITGDISVREEVRAGRKMIRRSGAFAGGNLAAVVAENITPSGVGEVCLAVRLTGAKDRLTEMVAHSEQIMAIGENFGGNIAINTCLRGYISGKLKSTEKTACMDELLARLGAKQRDRQIHERYISCTAYTPAIKRAVRLGGENINLHIVFRETEERTEIYVASPILMMEY